MSSSQHSRIVHIETRSKLSQILVSGDAAYVIDPPVILAPGNYRAELDPETHTASITLIALSPEEAPE